MMLLNLFRSTPFKTLSLLSLSLLFACQKGDDQLNNNSGGGNTGEPPVVTWNVEACLDAGTTSAVVGDPISFSSCSESVASYQWSIDGNVVSTAESLDWTFEMPGDYNLELKIGNGDGKTSSTNQEVKIQEATNYFFAVDIPHPALRHSLGFQAVSDNDLFLFTENQDEGKIQLSNYNANLKLKWKTSITDLNWQAALNSVVPVDGGWLINTTETTGGDSYLSKWIVINSQGAIVSEMLTDVFYHKIVSMNNDSNDFLAVGNRLILLDNGQVGTQAILDQYAGDLSMLKSAKLHPKVAASFGSDVTLDNGAFQVLSFVQTSSGNWQVNHQNLTDFGPVTTSNSLAVDIPQQGAINNINPELLVAGDQIFIRVNQKLFIPGADGQVTELPYEEVVKVQTWNDKIFILTNSRVCLADNEGNLIWQRHLTEGNTMGAALIGDQMLFDRDIRLTDQDRQIYLGAVSDKGIFTEY